MTRLRAPLLALFVAALLVRAAFILLEPPAQRIGDEGMWRKMGRELASPEVRFSPLRSRLISHPPLYPYMIAASFAWSGGASAVKWAQAVLGALLVPAVGLLGARIYGRRVGVFGAACAAFDPVLVWQSAHFWSEVLFLALLWWGIERLVQADVAQSPAAATLAGFSLGLSVLARETVYYFLPLAAVWLAWRRPHGWRRAALFLLACFVTVAPWAYRNHLVFGSALPIATRGTLNLWKGNAERPWPEVHAEYSSFGDEHTAYREAGRRAWLEIRARQPWWALRKLLREMPELWGVNSLPIIHVQSAAYGPLPVVVNWLVAAATVVPYVAVLVLAVVGCAASRLERGRLLLLVFLVAYTALHVVVFGFPRFRLPVMPVVFLLAGLGWQQWRSGPALPAWRRALAVVLAIGLAATVARSAFTTFVHPAFGLSAGEPQTPETVPEACTQRSFEKTNG